MCPKRNAVQAEHPLRTSQHWLYSSFRVGTHSAGYPNIRTVNRDQPKLETLSISIYAM